MSTPPNPVLDPAADRAMYENRMRAAAYRAAAGSTAPGAAIDRAAVNRANCCGRDASHPAPPAQIRTCGIPAYGSYLG